MIVWLVVSNLIIFISVSASRSSVSFPVYFILFTLSETVCKSIPFPRLPLVSLGRAATTFSLRSRGTDLLLSILNNCIANDSRLSSLVTATTAVGYAMASPHSAYSSEFWKGMIITCGGTALLLWGAWVWFFILFAQRHLGTYLAIACSQTFNQIFELESDSKMTRTENRLLPRGVMSTLHAGIYGVTTGIVRIDLFDECRCAVTHTHTHTRARAQAHAIPHFTDHTHTCCCCCCCYKSSVAIRSQYKLLVPLRWARGLALLSVCHADRSVHTEQVHKFRHRSTHPAEHHPLRWSAPFNSGLGSDRSCLCSSADIYSAEKDNIFEHVDRRIRWSNPSVNRLLF